MVSFASRFTERGTAKGKKVRMGLKIFREQKYTTGSKVILPRYHVYKI